MAATDPASAVARPATILPAGQANDYPSIDGLRAVAALFVMFVHASFNTTANLGTGGFLFARMDSGVSVFFVISGFLLYRPFVAAVFDNERRAPRLGPYLFRRALRIYPAYFLAALVIAYGFGRSPYVDLGDAIEHLSLVFIYTDDNVISGPIFQAWSLGTEVSFYLAVPLLGWVASRIGWRTAGRLGPQLVFVGSLVALATAYRYWIEETQGLMSGAYLTWLPGYLDQFAGGMALAVLVAWRSAGHGLPTWLRTPGFAVACWVIGLGIFFATTRIGISPTDLAYTTGQQMARQAMYGLYSTLLVAPAVFGVGTSPVERFLRAPGLRHLGLVSYGIYLWHVFFIDRYQRWSGTPLFGGNFEDALLFTFVASTLTATASYVLVERPVLRLKRLWPTR